MASKTPKEVTITSVGTEWVPSSDSQPQYLLRDVVYSAVVFISILLFRSGHILQVDPLETTHGPAQQSVWRSILTALAKPALCALVSAIVGSGIVFGFLRSLPDVSHKQLLKYEADLLATVRGDARHLWLSFSAGNSSSRHGPVDWHIHAIALRGTGRPPGLKEGEWERPAVVLIHGHSAGSALWEAVIDRVGAVADIYCLDLPGWGRSPAPKQLLAAKSASRVTELHVEMLRGWLKAANLPQKKIILAGHSYGGFLSIHFASAHPRLVEQLIVCAPAGLAPVMPEGSFAWGTFFRFLPPQRFARIFGRLGYLLFRTLYLAFTTEDKRFPDYYYQLSAATSWTGCGDRPAAHFLQFSWSGGLWWSAPCLSHLMELEMPVSVIWGQRDDCLPALFGPLLHRIRPNTDLYLIKDALHNPAHNNARAMCDSITDCILKLRGAPRVTIAGRGSGQEHALGTADRLLDANAVASGYGLPGASCDADASAAELLLQQHAHDGGGGARTPAITSPSAASACAPADNDFTADIDSNPCAGLPTPIRITCEAQRCGSSPRIPLNGTPDHHTPARLHGFQPPHSHGSSASRTPSVALAIRNTMQLRQQQNAHQLDAEHPRLELGHRPAAAGGGVGGVGILPSRPSTGCLSEHSFTCGSDNESAGSGVGRAGGDGTTTASSVGDDGFSGIGWDDYQSDGGSDSSDFDDHDGGVEPPRGDGGGGANPRIGRLHDGFGTPDSRWARRITAITEAQQAREQHRREREKRRKQRRLAQDQAAVAGDAANGKRIAGSGLHSPLSRSAVPSAMNSPVRSSVADDKVLPHVVPAASSIKPSPAAADGHRSASALSRRQPRFGIGGEVGSGRGHCASCGHAVHLYKSYWRCACAAWSFNAHVQRERTVHHFAAFLRFLDELYVLGCFDAQRSGNIVMYLSVRTPLPLMSSQMNSQQAASSAADAGNADGGSADAGTTASPSRVEPPAAASSLQQRRRAKSAAVLGHTPMGGGGVGRRLAHPVVPASVLAAGASELSSPSASSSTSGADGGDAHDHATSGSMHGAGPAASRARSQSVADVLVSRLSSTIVPPRRVVSGMHSVVDGISETMSFGALAAQSLIDTAVRRGSRARATSMSLIGLGAVETAAPTSAVASSASSYDHGRPALAGANMEHPNATFRLHLAGSVNIGCDGASGGGEAELVRGPQQAGIADNAIRNRPSAVGDQFGGRGASRLTAAVHAPQPAPPVAAPPGLASGSSFPPSSYGGALPFAPVPATFRRGDVFLLD